MIRHSRPFTFLKIAEQLSRLGTCDRKRVGAVIVRDGRCISWGYNGAPPGMPHCDENNHGWYTLEAHECQNATHAEANALAFAAKEGISTDGGVLYTTVSPCTTCARLLIAAGICEVYYSEEYRDDRGLQLLERAGTACHYCPL